jgi:hypothetical protein
MNISEQDRLRLEKLLATTHELALGVQSYKALLLDDAKEAYENATKTVVGLEAIINELRKQQEN